MLNRAGRLGLLVAMVTLAVAVVVPIVAAGAQPEPVDEPVTVVFKAGSASLVPQADGSTRLVLDDLASKVRVDAPDAPKHSDGLAILEADADGAIVARLEAKDAPDGAEDLHVVLTDVQYEGDGSISAVIQAEEQQEGEDATVAPEGTAEDVTLTAEIDRPTDADESSSDSGGSGYVVTMPWQSAKYKQMDQWIFEVLSKECSNNENATAPLTKVNPTGGRGWPVASIDFALVVDNSGDCFWKSTKLEFKVKTGTDAFKAGSCTYEIKQIGPRAFEAKATQLSQNTTACDATGGINIISGYLTGNQRD